MNTSEPIEPAASTPLPGKKKSPFSRVLKFVLVIALLAIAGYFVLVVFNTLPHEASDTPVPSESVVPPKETTPTLQETERAAPLNFLEAGGTFNKNFWGSKLKIHGSIANRATLASYKDPVIEVTFYSAADSALDRKQYPLHLFLPPKASTAFELKVDKPDACKTIKWRVIGAMNY